MAWIKIASGTSPDNVKSVSDIQHLDKGTEFRIDIKTDFVAAGLLADLIGAEFIAALFVQGGDVIDVEGTAWNRIRIHCVADPPLGIAGIILALATLGVLAYMITNIEIFANIAGALPETIQWVAIGIMAVCGVILVSRIPKRRGT